MTESDNKPRTRKWLPTRKQVIKLGGNVALGSLPIGGGIAALAYNDSITTGTHLNPGEAGAPQPDDIIVDGKKLSTLEQLTQHPVSRSALMILSLLTYSKGKAALNTIADGKTPVATTYKKDMAATDTYNKISGKFKNKGELFNVTMLDPSVKNMAAAKKLEFRMIAHHSDPNPKNDFEATAYYNDESQSLMLVFAGVDPPKLTPLIKTMGGQLNPQLNGVDNFMLDVQHQIAFRKLKVKNSVIFGHSIGADSAVKALAFCMQHNDFQTQLGHKMPQAVLVEDWMGRQTAENCEEISKGKITVKEMEKYIMSVRHWPASFTGEKENRPLGRKVAIMPKHPERVDINPMAQWNRQIEHRILPTVEKLASGQENIHEDFKGEFIATRLFSDVADPLFRDAVQHPIETGIGAGAAAVAGIAASAGTGVGVRATVNGVKSYVNQVRERKNAKLASSELTGSGEQELPPSSNSAER